MAALLVAPKWKAIQCPSIAERINSGVITQRNTDNWGNTGHIHDDAQRQDADEKLSHKSSYYVIAAIRRSKTGKMNT